ncbi:amidohydrolase [Sphingobacteriaceae bacterium]|nr:amidohydrolase [Sphingobacteriaceae bacterium]
MRFLKADKIFDGQNYLAADALLVLDGKNTLTEIISETRVEKAEVEYHVGILTPGFINAHCHLELSHLKGKIAQHSGLPAFAKEVVSLRNTIRKEEISSDMQEANIQMWNKGIVAVGDISNTEDSFQEKLNSKIYYHTFLELIGLNPANANVIFAKGLQLLEKLLSLNLAGSLSPHAPYSTSKELIKLIADQNVLSNTSLSIHNQESEEEHKFFHGEPSAFEDLYRSLGLDLTWYKAPNTASLLHYVEVLSAKPSILVHNTFTKAPELTSTETKNIFWCFCPGANLYIENKLPDFSIFAGKKNTVVLGTDSLASNTDLDIIAEANLVSKNTNVFSKEDLLRAVCSNGAAALGISEHYGHLLPGKNAGINLINFTDSKINFIKKIA